MGHAALLYIGPGAALDEDGRPDSTADCSWFTCEPCATEAFLADWQEPRCSQCAEPMEPTQ